MPNETKTIRFFRRVSVPVELYLTVEVSSDDSGKLAAKASTALTLNSLTDAEGNLQLERFSNHSADPQLFVSHKPEPSQQMKLIFPLKGFEVLDSFSAEMEDAG